MTGLNNLSPEEQQCLTIFLRHYNAEQGKNFQAAQKLDDIYRNVKMPDVLCSDGNDYLIVEVTSVYFERQDQKYSEGWHEIFESVINSIQGKVSGLYVVNATYPVKWRGQSGKCKLINSLSTVIQKNAQGMKVGQSIDLNNPIKLKLIKCSDAGNGFLFQSDPNGFKTLSPDYITEVFCPILTETSEKFANAQAKYPNATSVLLIENRNWLLSETDPDDCKDVASVIARFNYKNIDSVYLVHPRKQKLVRIV